MGTLVKYAFCVPPSSETFSAMIRSCTQAAWAQVKIRWSLGLAQHVIELGQ